MKDVKTLKDFVELIGLDKKHTISQRDKDDLVRALIRGKKYSLALYIVDLDGPGELSDLIVNTIYG